MPIYQYEAMDSTGAEVKDTVEATTAEEAHTKVRQLGYFVTKLGEKGKKKKRPGAKKAALRGKRKKTFVIGGVSNKILCTFTRQFSTLQDAGLPVLRSIKILEGQAKPGPLKNTLGAQMKEVFETGVRYQAYHALGLFVVAWAAEHFQAKLAFGAGWCFIAGIFLFSGSLSSLSLTGILKFGAITPLGGLLFIIGWALLAFSPYRIQS